MLAAGTHKAYQVITTLTNAFGVTEFTLASIGKNYKNYIAEQQTLLTPTHLNSINAVFSNISKSLIKNK